jgi:hypothetical protein
MWNTLYQREGVKILASKLLKCQRQFLRLYQISSSSSSLLLLHLRIRPSVQFPFRINYEIMSIPNNWQYPISELYKQMKKTQRNIRSLSGIGTHDPSAWADEDTSCLRPRGQCGRPSYLLKIEFWLLLPRSGYWDTKICWTVPYLSQMFQLLRPRFLVSSGVEIPMDCFVIYNLA